MMLGLGIEQIMVRRIALSSSAQWTVAAYLWHSLASSIAALLLLYGFVAFMGDNDSKLLMLPLFFAAQAIIYIASPLKQYLNAKEHFTPYGIIAVLSNTAKIVLVFAYIKYAALTISAVVNVLLVTSLFELVALAVYIICSPKYRFPLRFRVDGYKKLVKESVPQYISVIFDTALSRVDWILLGILSTSVATAEYSFAYRASELAKLPIIAIGPIILIKYSRMLGNDKFTDERKHETTRILNIEIFVAVLIVLVLNVFWRPVIGYVTHGKYGDSNALIFGIISLSLPFHFLINLLWSLCFSAKKYVQITKIAIVIAIVNLSLNLILIPIWGGVGAAISYLLSIVIQSIVYFRLVGRTLVPFSPSAIILLPIAGILCYLLGMYISNSPFVQVVIAVVPYIVISILAKQVQKSDIEIVKQYFKK